MNSSNQNPDTEIVSRRIFAVSKKFLFQAFSNPTHLKIWWGPTGFTNTFHEFNFRVGGQWRFTMHAPEQGNFENHCEFTQIEPESLIAWKRYSKPLFRVEFTFEEVAHNVTELIFRMLFDTPEECEKLKKYVVDKNEENFDRLEKELERMLG